VRAVVLAVCRAATLPARADVDAKLRHSVYDRRVTGTLLVVIGSLNVALSLATVAAYELSPTCSYGAKCFNELGGGAIGLASAAVAIPTFGAGLTQLRTASSDAFTDGEGVPPRALRRARRAPSRLGRTPSSESC
jgi:hypothetical protein